MCCMNQLIGLALAIGLCAGQPEDALKVSDTWSRDQAAHLLRRAGFGGTPPQIDHLAGLNRKRAVEYLVNFERIPNRPLPIRIGPHPLPIAWTNPDITPEQRQELQNKRRQADRLQFERIVGWWIRAMTTSKRPLEEKLVLFWHGHFTSGYREVRSSRAMYFQNELFRKHAAGNFRDLLQAITHDPAMIRYLNTDQNYKGKPNENYARELMELFTMGPGHYTEDDIKQAARALTGIGIDHRTGEMMLHGGRHDYLTKTFLGRTGDFDDADIIDIILKQPATAEFLARKLWTFFAYENPDKRIVAALADILRKNDYELRPMLTAMFSCDPFHDDRAHFTHIKSPVELLVGTLRALEIEPLNTRFLDVGLQGLGQQLMQPPNVKGWDGGKRWITTSSLLKRYNFLGSLLDGNDNARERLRRRQRQERLIELLGEEAGSMKDDFPPLQPAYDPMPIIKAEKLMTAGVVVNHFVNRLLQRPIAPERRRALIKAIMPHINRRNIQTPSNTAAMRGLIHLIMSMPEYQLS